MALGRENRPRSVLMPTRAAVGAALQVTRSRPEEQGRTMGEQRTSAACEQAPHLLLPCLVGQERRPPLRQKGWHSTNYYSNSTERGWTEEGDLLCWRDSAPGPRDAEKMQRKWTTAIRKPDRDLQRGPWGAPASPWLSHRVEVDGCLAHDGELAPVVPPRQAVRTQAP